jgi:hypothetical protein
LAAAGLVTGEAVVGVLVAIPVVLSGDATVLAVAQPCDALGLVGFIAVIGLFVRLSHRTPGSKGAP